MKIALISAGAILGLVTVVSVPSYIGAYNYGNRAEAQIDAIYQNNENVLAQYGQKVAEAVGVTSIAAEQMEGLLTGSLQARYGDDGAQANFLAIQESFPGLDQGIYVQIQRIVEAGRNDFQKEQTKLVDAKRAYNTALGSFWQGTWMSMAGYPSINVGYPLGTEDDYPVISTARANQTFETGEECGNALTAANGTDDC
jgi:hypothetical protein